MTKYNYDEVFNRLESYKKEIRRLNEASMIRSKTGKSFKKHNDELEACIKLLEKQNGSLEMQLMECNMLLEQYELTNKSLLIENNIFKDSVTSSLNSLDTFLLNKKSVEEITHSLMQENENLKRQVDELKHKIDMMESEARGRETMNSTFGVIMGLIETYHQNEQQDTILFADLYSNLDSRLLSILKEREKIIAEANSVSKENPSELIMKKNKMMSEDLEKLTSEVQKLRMELSDLKSENCSLREKLADQSAKPKPVEESAPNVKSTTREAVKPNNSSVHRETPLNQDKRTNAISTNENKKVDLKKGFKFCNECGGMLKKNEKSTKCLKCDTIFHQRCVSKEEMADPYNFICKDCCD